MSALAGLIVAVSLSTLPSAEPVTNEQVRASIQRSIPYIEAQGEWWIEEKKCVTCHRVGNMLWSLAAARANGFATDDRFEEWLNWSIEKETAKNDKGELAGSTNKEGVAQLLMTLNLLDSSKQNREAVESLSAIVANGIEADGTWKPGGQLPAQKRPAVETTEVSTAWLALALHASTTHPDVVDQAVARLEQSSAGQSTEWFVAKLLLAETLNQTSLRQRIDALIAQQNDDGGWGWIAGESSDALGTGMALYALHSAGITRDNEAVNRALHFLIKTQAEDGSWPVKGTKTKKQDNIEETATYWGTTWATLGLLSSLQVDD